MLPSTSMERKPEGLPFPQEPLRHWYLTPLGGSSPDLEFFQVGILAEALRQNTELRPGQDRVRVGILGRRHRRPLMLDGFFEVVPLDSTRPDAREKSPRGEAVLPEGDEVIRAIEPPRPGDGIILNGVLARRTTFDPPGPDHIAAVLEEFLRERRADFGPGN